MRTHYFQLAPKPFGLILSGKKVIESRLFDDKRKLIQIGDVIVFTNREDSGATIRVVVKDLLHYAYFQEMFSSNNPILFGGDSAESLEQEIRKFYSQKDEEQYGVLGIRFEVVT